MRMYHVLRIVVQVPPIPIYFSVWSCQTGKASRQNHGIAGGDPYLILLRQAQDKPSRLKVCGCVIVFAETKPTCRYAVSEIIHPILILARVCYAVWTSPPYHALWMKVWFIQMGWTSNMMVAKERYGIGFVGVRTTSHTYYRWHTQTSLERE